MKKNACQLPPRKKLLRRSPASCSPQQVVRRCALLRVGSTAESYVFERTRNDDVASLTTPRTRSHVVSNLPTSSATDGSHRLRPASHLSIDVAHRPDAAPQGSKRRSTHTRTPTSTSATT